MKVKYIKSTKDWRGKLGKCFVRSLLVSGILFEDIFWLKIYIVNPRVTTEIFLRYKQLVNKME